MPGSIAALSTNIITVMSATYFRKQIFLPQDHGSWVFILSPLLVGLFAGGQFNFAALSLIVAAMTGFLIRQPVTIALKAYTGRRPRTDLPAAYFWVTVYGLVMALALVGLVASGSGYVLYLAIPGVPVFAWYLWLISRREERKQAGVEIMATGVLSLAAPAAYWVGTGRYDSAGWWLWTLVWMQSAASIVYAYLRLEQRNPVRSSNLPKMRLRAFAFTTFNLALSVGLGFASVLPRFIFMPYLLQWTETIWGILHPATGWKPTRIGIRQLIVSTLWTILFIITWRL